MVTKWCHLHLDTLVSWLDVIYHDCLCVQLLQKLSYNTGLLEAGPWPPISF